MERNAVIGKATVKRGRPRNRDLDARILNTVQKMMAERTADQFTLPEVAKAAGVGTDSIYRRWKSKESLLQDAAMALMEERARVHLEGDLRSNLVRTIVESSREILTGEGGGVMRATLIEALRPGGDAWREILIRDNQERREQTRRIVAKAKAEGELAADVDADELLDMVAGALWFQAMIYDHAFTKPEATKLVDRILAAF